MQKMPFPKGLGVLVLVGMLITASLGCQSRRSYRAEGAGPMGQATMYDDSSSGEVVQPATASRNGGCGAGCKSCGTKSLPVLSRLQGYAPASNNGSTVMQ